MSGQPWTKWYPGDFLNGIADLSPHEIAAYTVILNRIYDEDGPIPDDPAKIARRCNMRRPRCEKAIQSLVDAGKLIRENGFIDNPRAQKEIVKRHETNTKQTLNAHIRWQKGCEKDNKNNDGVMPPHCQTDAKPMPTRSQKLDSVPNGTGADAPFRATDPAKLVFEAGVKLLGSYDYAERDARKLVGKWRKGCRDPDLLAIFAEAGSKERGNIVEYIEGCLKNGGNKGFTGGKPSPHDNLYAGFAAAAGGDWEPG